MTQEEKQLLLKDLCARLPYGIIINYYNVSEKFSVDAEVIGYSNGFIEIQNHSLNPEYIKPYLRPMSSMTEEEDEEWRLYKRSIVECRDDVLEEKIAELHNWFNSKHFDWRGFIPKGLALEAPENMYKTQSL